MTKFVEFLINNGNRTEWSPVRSVIVSIIKCLNLIGSQQPTFIA